MRKARRSTNAGPARTASSPGPSASRSRSLFLDGKTVGRHYAGPNWEHIDGSAVVAKAAGNAPGATPKDIPWLKLAVTQHRGKGVLSGVTTIQRINTAGGVMAGGCDKAGAFHSAAYATDYVFLRSEHGLPDAMQALPPSPLAGGSGGGLHRNPGPPYRSL